MSPMWGAREEVTNEKTTFKKVFFFSWFAHTGLYVTYLGGKGGSNKRKNHVLESVFFSWFAHTGLYGTGQGRK